MDQNTCNFHKCHKSILDNLKDILPKGVLKIAFEKSVLGIQFFPTVVCNSGFRIRVDLMRIRIPDPDPGFDDLKLKKNYN